MTSSSFSVVLTLLFLVSSSWAFIRPNRLLAANDTVLSSFKTNENFNDQLDYLLSDDQPSPSIGTQNGLDVDITDIGDIDVILDGELTFEFCADRCTTTGEVSVCFDGVKNPTTATKCLNQCSFIVRVDSNTLWFMTSSIERKFAQGCGKAKIQDPMEFSTSKHPLTASGCDRGSDKNVKLFVKSASKSCVLTVKNAKIKPPSTVSTTTEESSTSLTSSTTSTDEAGFPLYGWILIGVGSFIILIILCFMAVWFVMKGKSKKHGPPEGQYKAAAATENKKVVIEMPESPIKNIQKKAEVEGNEVEHEEFMTPAVDSKVEQINDAASKPKEKEEQANALKPEPSAEKIPVVVKAAKKIAPRNPHIAYPMAYRSEYNKAKSLKSGTHSVSERMDVNKIALVESHVDSLSRHDCLEKMSFKEVGQMRKETYAQVRGRAVRDNEINIFLCSISEMFAELNRMSAEAERELVGYGVQFDDKKRITQMTEKAREYLKLRSTPEYVVYFAFGAEYSEYITSELGMIHKFSLPLLMVIALMKQFPDFNRRKACTWIRRQVSTIQHDYTLRERSSKAFPINILENAYFKNPEVFTNIDGLDTDSKSREKQPSNQSQTSNQSTVIDLKKKPAEDVTQESKTMKKNKKKIIIVKSQPTQSGSRKKSKKKQRKETKNKK